MSTLRFQGGAAPVAQINTYPFAGTWEADDLVRIAAGNKKKDLTGGSTVTNTVVATISGLIAALDTSVYPEMVATPSGITPSASTSTLTFTANTAGVPFTLSLTPLEADGSPADAQTIGGGTSAYTGVVATANAGPNCWGTAFNWDGHAIPATNDSVYIDNTDQAILWDLDQSAVQPTLLGVGLSYTGTIGLPKTNALGATYPEYRDDYLKISPATLYVGYGPGSGSSRLKFNTGTVQTAVVVDATGTGQDPGIEALLWKGTNAANTMTVRGQSSVGVAIFGGETATLATLNVEDQAAVRCGPGVTLGTVTHHGGTLVINSAIVTSLTVYAGTVTINGTGAVAQITVLGGTVIYNTSGTLGGSTVIKGDGKLDFSQDPRAKTVTNPIDVYAADAVNDPDKVVASLVLDFNGITPFPGLGTDIRLTRAATA